MDWTTAASLLVAGILIGWLIKWVIDWVYGRGHGKGGAPQADASAELGTLRADLDASTAANAKLRADLDGSTGTNAKFEQELALVRGNAQQYSARLGDLEMQMIGLRGENNDLSAKLLAAGAAGAATGVTLAGSPDASLQADLNRMRDENAALRSINLQLTGDLDALRGQHATLTGGGHLQAENNRLTAELAALRAQTPSGGMSGAIDAAASGTVAGATLAGGDDSAAVR